MKARHTLRRSAWILLLGIAGFCVLAALWPDSPLRHWVERHTRPRATVATRVREYGPAARGRLAPDFARAGVAYPPKRVVLAGFKTERRLEVYASDGGPLRYIRSYRILAASGRPGPKLRYGDGQVPEGLYGISFLNPNSAFHLSLRVDYPNAFDRAQAATDGRNSLGGDIMIHGSNVSAGCLAMGDQAAEDLFVLAADAGRENVSVILSPVDFRRSAPPEPGVITPWLPKLYDQIEAQVRALPRQG